MTSVAKSHCSFLMLEPRGKELDWQRGGEEMRRGVEETLSYEYEEHLAPFSKSSSFDSMCLRRERGGC